MTTSGTYNWTLDNAGIVTEAFSRCGIHPTALTREHFISATRSLNLALAAWSNRGVNLWQVDLQAIPMVAGVPTYNLPSTTVNILDAYLETYTLQTNVAGAPNFGTVQGSAVVTVNMVQHDLSAGNWINVIIQSAIGGLVLQGLYQVTTVLNPNQFTITAASAATSTATGGALPVFTATGGLQTISVALTAHGLSAGNTFQVPVATSVGGIVLQGPYLVSSITDANNFVISIAETALANDVETENEGAQSILTQANSGEPFDRVMTSISRTDYSALPNKLAQAAPTTFWFDRLSPIPSVTLWQVPDGNGPYMFFYYRMRRMQDASAQNGQTADIPYRFLEALVGDMAKRLARKYAPALYDSLKADAAMAWEEAAQEDRERVETFIVPELSGYFR